MKRPGFDPGRGRDFFSSPPLCSDQFWGPPSLLSNGCWGIFPGSKAPGREADNWPQSSSEVNAWRYTSTPQYVVMAWCLVKYRDNFTFIIIIIIIMKLTVVQLVRKFPALYDNRGLTFMFKIVRHWTSRILCQHRRRPTATPFVTSRKDVLFF